MVIAGGRTLGLRAYRVFSLEHRPQIWLSVPTDIAVQVVAQTLSTALSSSVLGTSLQTMGTELSATHRASDVDSGHIAPERVALTVKVCPWRGMVPGAIE
jgi:hypothetical protein